MFISVTFRIPPFRILPFIPQKNSALNFPQITPQRLSAFRNPHSAIRIPQNTPSLWLHVGSGQPVPLTPRREVLRQPYH